MMVGNSLRALAHDIEFFERVFCDALKGLLASDELASYESCPGVVAFALECANLAVQARRKYVTRQLAEFGITSCKE